MSVRVMACRQALRAPPTSPPARGASSCCLPNDWHPATTWLPRAAPADALAWCCTTAREKVARHEEVLQHALAQVITA